MLYKLWLFSHNTLGLHIYTLFSLPVIIAMIIMGVVHTRNQRKRDKDFEDEMEKLREEASSETSVEGQEA